MPFHSQSVSFAASGQFSRLFLDYVSGNPALQSYYSSAPTAEGYKKATADFFYEEKNRALLSAVFQRQYKKSGLEVPAALAEKFAKPGTLTVTTGHQLCLFTGPLFFIYKVISTIRLAEQLEKQTGKEIVPVYWMASEDHDFDEIASVNLFGKTLKWEKPGGGAVGNLPTDSLGAMLAELKTIMGESANAVQLHALFSEAYRPGRKLAEAMRELVHRLFEGKILILDGDDAELKKTFIPFFQKDIFSGEPFRLTEATIAELAKAGYEAQVSPREINTFYLGGNFRERIERNGDQFHVLNTSLSFSKEELEQELENHPEKFSPNVVLRPVYQQVILPNLAYVGGPGELAYWLEFKKMFGELNVFFPVLQPRNFILVYEKSAADRMNKLGLQPEDLFVNIEDLVKRFVASAAGDSLSFETEKENLRQAFVSVIAKAEAADPTLKKNAEAELAKALNSLDALNGKMLRAEKQKQENTVNQLRKLHAKFFPEGNLQERYENFVPLWIQKGPALIEELSAGFTWPIEGIQLLSEA